MAEETLKKKTVKSMGWTAVQKFGTLALTFITNLVLARFLAPDDFGIYGMLTVFIAVGEVFIDSGLGSALIQKTNPTDEDYSTVFWANLGVSLVLFVILFACAPLISNFYGMNILTNILRVMAGMLIIQAFRLIQTTRLQKELKFKKMTLIYLIAGFISMAVAIAAAVLLPEEYRVWALVIKNMLDTFIRTVIFWIVGHWKPLLKFSIKSFRELFSFGGVMLVTTIIMRIYTNLQTLIIGKAFNAENLGYYTQANKLQDVPASALDQIVNQVTYPVFSQLKDNKERMKNGLKKIVTAVAYVGFPMMVFFVLAASPIILLLFKDKWALSIEPFMYLCLVGMLVCVNTMNTNLIKATGNKWGYFRLQVIKRIIGIALIIGSVFFRYIDLEKPMRGLLIARVVVEYLFFFINANATRKAVDYKVREQVRDIMPAYILSFATAGIIFMGKMVPNLLGFIIGKSVNVPAFLGSLYSVFEGWNAYFTSGSSIAYLLSIVIQFVLFVAIYVGISMTFKFKGFTIFKEILFSRLLGKKSASEEKNIPVENDVIAESEDSEAKSDNMKNEDKK